MTHDLPKEYWQWLAHVAQEKFNAARSKPGEPKNSEEFIEKEKSVMQFLLKKAF